MASPFDARAPALFLPADWTDTDQRIIESLLLPPPGPEGEWTPRAVELPPKRVEQLLDAGEKGAAVAQAATPTPLATPASMAAPTRARSPGDKKVRGSRRRVTIEEKRMKHREVQRRFMQRKKEAIAQVKQSIGALEQQLRLMKLAAERAALEAENSALKAHVDAPARGQEELLRKFLLEIPLVEKIFRPVTAERWEEIACQTLSCIDGIFSDCSLRSTGFSVLGWTDHRDVQDSTVKFTLSKSFPNVCAEQLWNRSWERISTDSYASFFSPSLHVRKHLLQQVCDDAIIIYRGICYPQTARISRAVEIISRVRRADDFIFFIRSLDVAEVRQELSTPDVWTQSLTALRFSPTDPEHPESGCTVHYGGSYENIPTGGIRYWLMEILFLVLRFESALISPMFALCE